MMICDDINFLEYPNWVLNKSSSANTWVVENKHGRYEMSSLKGMPSYFDKMILYYLIYKLFSEARMDAYCVVTSRYDIAKNVFFNSKNFGSNHYLRIMDSLKKWKQIAIFFDGVFYQDGRHIIKFFSFIDDVTLDKESGELTITFGKAYIDQLRGTTFCKYVDFEKYKRFSRAVSARLYEILIKSFEGRDTWPISIQLLAEKLTLTKQPGARVYYASQVVRQIKSAINEINRKTDLYIQFDYNNTTDVCIFKKSQKPKEFTPAIVEPKTKSSAEVKKELKQAQDIAACFEAYSNLPDNERSRIDQSIKHDDILKVLPDKETKIYQYMRVKGLWLSQK